MIYGANAYGIRYSDGTGALEDAYLYFRRSNVPYKTHTVKEDETLHSIAIDKYNNIGMWFVISEFNNLEFPFELEIGTQLRLPDER